MSLEVLKEVTEWKVDYRQPNHIYLMDGSRPIAYQKWGEGEPIYYTTKQKLDKTKFKKRIPRVALGAALQKVAPSKANMA